MSSPLARATLVSTTGSVVATDGVLTYAEAVGGTFVLYAGTSTGGDMIATITSSGYRSFNTPVKYKGLYATLTAGTGIIHTG